MPDRRPLYGFRGRVAPTAAVSRPVAWAFTDSGPGQPAAGRAATLDIFDVINSIGGYWGISAADVDRALVDIGDVSTLYVRLNSPGGEALEGVAIATMLRAHPAAVRVTVYGLAASAASAVAMAGDVVNVAPGAMMMVHDPAMFDYGTPADLRKTADFLDQMGDGFAGLYAGRAGGTAEQWRAVMRAETWYSAQGAVDAGLADTVGIDPAPRPVAAGVLVDAEPAMDELGFAQAVARFDLSIFAHPPAVTAQCRAKTPAEPQGPPPTTTEEADTMSDTLMQGLRERLGVNNQASEAQLLAALDEALGEHAEPPADTAAETAVLRRELQSTQEQLAGLIEARASDEQRTRAAERQRVFAAAFARGAVHPPDHPERVQDEADYDAAPAVMTRVLESRATGSRFPVAAAGYSGGDDDDKPADTSWFPQFSGPTARVEG